jgi:hypothetical protein
MALSQRAKFRSTQDWFNFLSANPQIDSATINGLRFAVYQDIERLRKRPLLVYATRFVDFNLPGAPNFIDLGDVDGFTDLINAIPTNETSIDVLVHSPGGRPDATERIVAVLRQRFSEVHFLIPHSAYSAATMLALSGNSVTLHPSATMGPIDPQINGVPARSIKKGFERVRDLVKKEGPEALPAYIPLIEKYSLELLELCADSEKLSKELVSSWLKSYMLNGKPNATQIARKTVKYFSEYDRHLLHSRPILLSKIDRFGLSISQCDGELAELLWETYILLNGFMYVTPFVKLFENNRGISFGRQVQIMPAQQPGQP